MKHEDENDRILDLRGWSSPWCIVKVKSWLRRMQPGQVLEILCSDSETVRNFPFILKNGKHRMIEVKQHPEYHRIFIRRG